MKKYTKPEIKFDEILVSSPLAALSVNSNEAANYNNVTTDSWGLWADLFN